MTVVLYDLQFDVVSLCAQRFGDLPSQYAEFEAFEGWDAMLKLIEQWRVHFGTARPWLDPVTPSPGRTPTSPPRMNAAIKHRPTVSLMQSPFLNEVLLASPIINNPCAIMPDSESVTVQAVYCCNIQGQWNNVWCRAWHRHASDRSHLW